MRHAERRHAHQAELMTAQDDRVAVVLATTVSLAALAALAAAIALAVPRDAASVLVASLIALAGFSGSSALILTAARSRQFKTPGGAAFRTPRELHRAAYASGASRSLARRTR